MADYHGTAGADILDQDKLGVQAGENLYGGKGNDTITATGANMIGEEGNDTLTALTAWAGAAYWTSPTGVKVNLATGVAQDGFGGTDKLVNVRTVMDSSHDDEITGSSANETFWLSWGSDKVVGGGGTDSVNFYNMKSSEVGIKYDIATDTFTLTKHTAAGDQGVVTLTGIQSINFTGPQSDNILYSRDMFDDSKGFLRQLGTVPGAEMGNVNQLRAGDFNGDGKLDVLVTRTRGDVGATKVPLQVLVGDGQGHFTDQTATLFKGGIPYVNYVPRIFAADFNKDGITDIFTPDFGLDTEPFPGGQNGLWLSNKATGQLENATATLPQGLKQNHGTSIGDVNHDGYLDILVNALHETTGNANQLLINDGTGHFQPNQSLLPAAYHQQKYDPGNTWSLLQDLNGDGWDDIVLGTWGPNSKPTQVLLNDGHGSFANSTPVDLPRTGMAQDTVVGINTINLNGDNLPDLVLCVTNDGARDEFYHTPYIQFLVNDGNGHFHDETQARLPQSLAPQKEMAWIYSAVPTDVDGDGDQDLVVDGSNAATSGVYMNDGTGKFTLGWEGAPNQHLLAADVNSDGKIDLVEATYSGFSVLLNSFPAQIDASHVYRFGDSGGKVAGNAANETIHGGKGADTVDGGAGLDTMVVAAARGQATVKASGTGYTVTTGGVIDTLANVERIKFADGTGVALDLTGTAGQAYRLYQAVFDRTPDLEGLGYWIMKLDTGSSLHDVAQGFIEGGEFKKLYGANPTDAQFVDALYHNVLHRNGDAEGVQYWNHVLSIGAARADVLTSFSESPENMKAVATLIGNGIDYTPFLG
ncbi:DUF4214 domain-containing protein [Massilia arenosa]|uniref:DUF4214 domain-containing protein n=1 Tax=Zemynaea arenosa TaxID=2561931 RepID=A0A4Y9S6Q1_9BURK|nr:FG-GAP-like repeat-containing protein [Massilia arenosa]TFW15728.1 DUF4214 domain-containing protein [Massilia arenosa]